MHQCSTARTVFSLIAVLSLLLFGALHPGTTFAQEASPAAGCDAPDLPPGTPTPEEPSPVAEASPADEMAGMDMGTPEAVEEAEEIAETVERASPEPTVPGTPADEATAAGAIAGAENLIACGNAGDAEGLVALFTPAFLEEEFGSANPYDALVDFSFAQVTVESLGDAQTHGDGRLSVDIVFTGIFTEYSYLHHRWYLVDDGGFLKLDQWDYLPVEGADVQVTAEMLDFAFNLSQTEFAAGETIGFTVPNVGQYPHEFVVVRLPEGITIEQVFEDPSLEEQIAFIGFAFAMPGGTGYFGLTGLEAGTYTVVCFVDEPEGIPHVARGMVTEFAVR